MHKDDKLQKYVGKKLSQLNLVATLKKADEAIPELICIHFVADLPTALMGLAGTLTLLMVAGLVWCYKL